VRVGLARRKQRTLSRMGNGVNSRLPATDAYAEPAHTILFIDACRWIQDEAGRDGEKETGARCWKSVIIGRRGLSSPTHTRFHLPSTQQHTSVLYIK